MLKKAVLLIFVRLPGLCIVLWVYFLGLMSSLAKYREYAVPPQTVAKDPPLADLLMHPLMHLIVATVGGVLILVAAGKLKQWMYLFVFWSFPLAPALAGYITARAYPSGIEGPGLALIVLVALILPCVVYYSIKRFYRSHNGEY